MRATAAYAPLLLSFLTSFHAGLALAQTSQITGSVTDPSGAAIAGAQVTASHLETKVQRRVMTSGSGYYTVPLLPDGTYRLDVEAPGFSSAARQNLKVDVGQT